jgi:septum formation protein
MNAAPRLVLGSSSPRRVEILNQINLPPDIIQGADINEDIKRGELPHVYCTRIAHEKCAALADKFSNDYIVTADTTCAVGRRILVKPEDVKDAERMLRLLSGRTHHILTAVCVRAPDGRISERLSDNKVKVKRLSDVEIADFIADPSQWDGFAGGYAFQKAFAKFVSHISGSHTGIVGLPAFETAQMLTGLGYRPK